MSTSHLINETHDASLTSWVDSANEENTDFPIQNLPFAIFRRAGSSEPFRGGVAIGDQIVDLVAATQAEIFLGTALKGAKACHASELNAFMGMGKKRLVSPKISFVTGTSCWFRITSKISGMSS